MNILGQRAACTMNASVYRPSIGQARHEIFQIRSAVVSVPADGKHGRKTTWTISSHYATGVVSSQRLITSITPVRVTAAAAAASVLRAARPSSSLDAETPCTGISRMSVFLAARTIRSSIRPWERGAAYHTLPRRVPFFPSAFVQRYQ